MLPKTLFKFLWHFIRPYRFTFSGMIFAVFLYAILTSVNPYLMKLIIDGVISHESSKESLFAVVWVQVVLFIIVYQAMDFSWAMYDFFKLKTLPRVREDIINKMFNYLQHHSFSYFQRQFSGSLSNKIADMARASESVISKPSNLFFRKSWHYLLHALVCI